MAQTRRTGRAPRAPRPLARLLPLIVFGLVLLALPTLATLYVDLRWFRAVGYEHVFTTIVWTEIALGAAVGAIVGGALFANLRLAQHLSRTLRGVVLADPSGQTRFELAPLVEKLVLPLVVIVALIAGLAGSQKWETWLRYVHASEFGVQDPIFHNDIAFYVFRVPAFEALSSTLSTILGMSLFFCALFYAARGGISFTPKGIVADRRARVHLSALAALLLALFAFDAWLARFDLLYSDLGPVRGASYADVHARLPMMSAQIAIAIVAAALVAVSATRQRLILAIAGVALYFAGQILGVGLYPSLVHRFSVLPNEAVKEAPYIAHNIEATRAAFGIADVTERELSGEVALTQDDIEQNRATIHNVRLWDHQPLLDTFAQIQEIRTYYEFASVDNDRYVIDGELRQTMLSPRELLADSLPNRTWINEHFTFTHGYGITLGPVNVATPEGLPELFVKDIPPESSAPSLRVTRPEIYFGELSNDYVLVRTDNREFDYPSGEENVYTEYEGQAGIHLDSDLTRAAVAMEIGSFKLLLSEDVSDSSRILLHRRIRDRVEKIAPFLVYDDDPYLVLRADGTLSWIQDAYTVTERYPYAHRPRPGMSYIRNSVKIVVDAYSGAVDLYVADADDPLLRTWRRIFPGLFKPLHEMPRDLRDHLRYPEHIFQIQTEVIATYHMDRPELLYNREDQWEVPTVMRQRGNQVAPTPETMVPYYTIMRLPGEREAEFIQMLPFTPKSKDNLAAWMVARSDGAHLGELVVYTFPKDRLVFGPAQVMNRINQDAEISRQISLWDQRGSEVNLGTLLVIPVEESLIYVCPLYLRSSGGRIPELKRVIVAYESHIAMEPTLDQALSTLFREHEGAATAGTEGEAGEGTGAEGTGADEGQAEAGATAAAEGEPAEGTSTTPVALPAEPSPSPATGTAAQRARTHFERAVAAQRRGDWATYGQELAEVEALLREMAPRPRETP